MSKYKDYKEFKTVNSNHLQCDTVGWDLLEVLSEESSDVHTDNYTDSSGYTQQKTTVAPFKTSMFLFGKSEEGVVADLKQQLDNAQYKVNSAESKTRELNSEDEKLKKEITSLSNTVETQKRAVEMEVKAKKRYKEANLVMEADLGKLRKALGEIRMNEILEIKND